MDRKTFNKWNWIVAVAVLVASCATYLATIEPTASFWDCGEFIASSYKLEVGHPPGNPVFQLLARFFTIPFDAAHAAVAVNAMNAILSGLTIFFLYLTIVFFAKRLTLSSRPSEASGEISLGSAIAILASGVVGAMAYCFSDTFWFSAVEGEVYAMSSLFTALVFWAMCRWYDTADSPHANRWIVLIAFLMGLSIGVHLLNLLTIPAFVFMYYYRMNEDKKLPAKKLIGIFLIGVVIEFLLVYIFIPYLPKVAAGVDRLFVNGFGLPYNSGALFFMVALLALCFWGLFATLKKGRVFWNTVLLCVTTLVMGFSLFSIVIIRSSVKTPTNEYQPDNPYTLVRYLSREQYGSTPLLYGQYWDAPYDLDNSTYWAPMNGKYIKAEAPTEAIYKPEGKMLFPRMWSSADPRYVEFYEMYTGGKGTRVRGTKTRKPTFGANLAYFFDYQLNWMYWRYFMWNFVGRQNDIHSPVPGNVFDGNWESGIGFLDAIRLGDQSDAPAPLRENKGKNHYFFLPLLLGLLGLVFQFDKDKRGSWIVFLMFFMTGIAIVLYLNQPPYQVRERDYAYAGSFYMFAIWIGLGVYAIYKWISDALKGREKVVAIGTGVLCLGVPALMAEENWDDHNRSNRYTAVETAKNYLNSVGHNGILVTHGDNDTFPLWYAREVEGFRTDVRVCNTSLLGTDWYIDQMKYACNDSPRLQLSVGQDQYLYGTNELVPIQDTRDQALPIADVLAVFRHPQAKLVYEKSGRKVDYWVSRKMIIPVNKENVLKYGILSEKFADMIPESIVLEIPKGKNYLSKPELFLLDFLSTYQWDRPINVLNQGCDLNIGLKDYLFYDGYSYLFVPVKTKVKSLEPGLLDPDELYDLIKNRFSFTATARDDYYVDYQNLYTNLGVMSLRNLFVSAANAFIDAGQNSRAVEMLDLCQEVLNPVRYPYENSVLGWSSNALFPITMVTDYLLLGERDKAHALADTFTDEVFQSIRFYLDFYPRTRDSFETCCNLVYYMANDIRKAGDPEYADALEQRISSYLSELSGSSREGEEPDSVVDSM
ncbi:MAG: DUF2723 domain-containing protein [Bacteroidales bacterium]|nr:DUF2723 domain-containing protein [Bacteroidales bacterium]